MIRLVSALLVGEARELIRRADVAKREEETRTFARMKASETPVTARPGHRAAAAHPELFASSNRRISRQQQGDDFEMADDELPVDDSMAVDDDDDDDALFPPMATDEGGPLFLPDFPDMAEDEDARPAVLKARKRAVLDYSIEDETSR